MESRRASEEIFEKNGPLKHRTYGRGEVEYVFGDSLPMGGKDRLKRPGMYGGFFGMEREEADPPWHRWFHALRLVRNCVEAR